MKELVLKKLVFFLPYSPFPQLQVFVGKNSIFSLSEHTYIGELFFEGMGICPKNFGLEEKLKSFGLKKIHGMGFKKKLYSENRVSS